MTVPNVSYEEAYRLAHAAGHDAGNRICPKVKGQAVWNREAMTAAITTFDKIMEACGHPVPLSGEDL